jgi:hypothetical protein
VAAAARKPRRDETLIKALVRAHRWRRRIESGRAKSITDLAEQEGVTDAYVCRLLPLTCLAPDIVEAIVDGRQPKGLRLAEMLGNGPVASPPRVVVRLALAVVFVVVDAGRRSVLRRTDAASCPPSPGAHPNPRCIVTRARHTVRRSMRTAAPWLAFDRRVAKWLGPVERKRNAPCRG